MRVVSASWEKRNLGVTCSEVTLESDDKLVACLEQISALTTQYQVVRVPSARLDLSSALEDEGFRFTEAHLEVQHNLDPPSLNCLLKRVDAATTVVEVPGADMERVEAKIHQGMFNTDRVFLDPAFSKEQAASRYVNWLRDEVNKGGSVRETLLGDLAMGFFTFRKKNDEEFASALSGLYSSAETPGMGTILLCKILSEGKREGFKRITSHISSNNVPVVKAHLALGFEISSISYTFVRHFEERGHYGE